MVRSILRLFSAMSVVWVVTAVPAIGQIEGLRARIPADANAIVVLDIEKLFGSPAAEKERWNARRKAAFDAGLTYLSPETRGVVIAAKFDLEFGELLWELAQVRLESEKSINTVATKFGGKIDTIEGKSSVRLPNDSYVVQLTPQSFAAYTPANRQDVARWLRDTNVTGKDNAISPYLSAGFDFVQKLGTPIIMAIDLHGVLSPEVVKEKLEASKLKTVAADRLPAIAETISSLKGVMLGVTVGEKPFGSIRVDFETSAAPVAEVGKELVIGVLERQGAMIDDIASWTSEVQGNTLLLKGSLSTSGLRRVLSVLELPPALGQEMEKAQLDLASDPESAARVASQQYFSSITNLLDDLKKERDRANVVTAGGVAMWYDKYARRIDNLPLLNVDAELLDYGRFVSSSLRSGETSLKGVGMRSGYRTTQEANAEPNAYFTVDSGYYGYGGYRAGYVGSYTDPYYAGRVEERNKINIRRQERITGAASVQEMWQGVEMATADIRRSMTEKYKAEF